MFRAPFSFKGRITRTEYTISLFLSPFAFAFIALFSVEFSYGTFIATFSLIGYLWLNMAQASKRCHDINQMAIMQIIPFYGFVLIFQEGTVGQNNYGDDPKSKETGGFKKIKKLKDINALLDLIQKSLPFSLLSVLLIIFCLEFLDSNPLIFNSTVYGTIIIGYLLFLLFIRENQYSFWSRLIFSTLIFLAIRAYTIVYLNYTINGFILLLELSMIVVGVSLTYISSYIHKSLIKIN